MKTGFLIGNMRVSVGFYIYMMEEANLYPSLAMWVTKEFDMVCENG